VRFLLACYINEGMATLPRHTMLELARVFIRTVCGTHGKTYLA
jgi:hypothetical protein